MVETRSSRAKKFLHNEPVGSHPRNRGKQATGIVRVPASTVKARSAKSTSRSRSPPTSQKSLELATTVPTPSSIVNDAPTKTRVTFDNFLQQTLSDRRTNGSTAIPFAFPGFYTPLLGDEEPEPTTKPGRATSHGKGKETSERKHVTFQGVGTDSTTPNDGVVRDRGSMSKAAYFACIRERHPKLREVDDFPSLYKAGQVLEELRDIAGPGSREQTGTSFNAIVAVAWESADYTRDIPVQFVPQLMESFSNPDNYGHEDVFLMIAQNTRALLPWISNKENRERATHAAMTMLSLGPEKRPQLRWHRTTARDFYCTTPPEAVHPSSLTL